MNMQNLDNLDNFLFEHMEADINKLLDEKVEIVDVHSKLEANDENENVSFKEFLHQFDELKKWLEQMNSFKSVSYMSNCEKYTNHISFEEILKRSPRKELLNEHACHVIKYYPHLKQEVLSKLRYLGKISSLSKYFIDQNISKDLQDDLNELENWLENLEYTINNLIFNNDWNIDDIEYKLNQHICLQYEIESRAKMINAVIKLSTKLKQSFDDYNKFYEDALILQNKWHLIWLKSLEWQCRLEQELNKKKKVKIK